MCNYVYCFVKLLFVEKKKKKFKFSYVNYLGTRSRNYLIFEYSYEG